MRNAELKTQEEEGPSVSCFSIPHSEEGMRVAKCEQGYRCEVCGGDVEEITESDLYLRYVLGEVDPERLHVLPERHVRCNPALAQYIVDPRFAAVRCEGPFAKESFDPAWVSGEEE